MQAINFGRELVRINAEGARRGWGNQQTTTPLWLQVKETRQEGWVKCQPCSSKQSWQGCLGILNPQVASQRNRAPPRSGPALAGLVIGWKQPGESMAWIWRWWWIWSWAAGAVRQFLSPVMAASDTSDLSINVSADPASNRRSKSLDVPLRPVYSHSRKWSHSEGSRASLPYTLVTVPHGSS